MSSEPKTTWRVEWLDVNERWRRCRPCKTLEQLREQIDNLGSQQVFRIVRIETREFVEAQE